MGTPRAADLHHAVRPLQHAASEDPRALDVGGRLELVRVIEAACAVVAALEDRQCPPRCCANVGRRDGRTCRTSGRSQLMVVSGGVETGIYRTVLLVAGSGGRPSACVRLRALAC